MAPPAIRTRVAPVALLVAFVFVVAAGLRVDREMTRAEEDRAALVASETATLVEVFLLRRVSQLHIADRVVDDVHVRAPFAPDSLARLWTKLPGLAASFDLLSVTDSTFNVLASVPLHAGAVAPPVGASIPVLTASAGRDVLERIRENIGRPLVFVDSRSDAPAIVFVEPMQPRRNAFLVGFASLDSLAALLLRQQRTAAYSIVVRAATDTILTVPARQRGGRTRTVEDEIVTPSDPRWTVVMNYTPSGRGVRITLWVVGLGAIIGLGVGLLLERREASRIADRSSELEHLSTELLRANRAKSEFLANVSHELRTPLNAIVGFVDLLRDGVYGALNARQVGPVERIEASANHLRHLVDQVLDLAKMAAGRLEVHTEPLELRPFVFDVASEVEPLITEKGLSFSLAVGASLPRVRTDPTHLRQILINLLGNAVKFTTNGGISVRGKLVRPDEPAGVAQAVLQATTRRSSRPPRSEGFWIALQVADSGMGIPEKDCERIFDEFEQVNAGPRGDSMRRGTGLGLSISRRLARLIGGDITVESELGRGSVFTVWLPVDPADLRGDRAA
jgi:signal transduction histidine kinase